MAHQEMCKRCRGSGRVKCPNPECHGGKVPDRGFKGFIINENFRPRIQCPECEGRGTIECPACDGKGYLII